MFVERSATCHIQADGGFIKQQQSGLMKQGTGYFHTSAVAAIELAHGFVGALQQFKSSQLPITPRSGFFAG